MEEIRKNGPGKTREYIAEIVDLFPGIDNFMSEFSCCAILSFHFSGSTIGVGLYVIAGHVARDEAGPGILLSFTVAGAVSLLSGYIPVLLCQFQYGGRRLLCFNLIIRGFYLAILSYMAPVFFYTDEIVHTKIIKPVLTLCDFSKKL